MPTTYLDFDLLIERSGDAYRAKVVESPAGQATADFQLPVSALEMENFILRIGRSLGAMRRDVEQVRRLESSEREAIKSFGGRLFEAVFDGEVKGCLRASLNEAFRRDAGLRIRLRLSETPELADVPWEYLYNPSMNRFFTLSTETPLVRYLDLPEGPRTLGVKAPLRILAMISSPHGYPQLDVAQEWDKLTEAVGDLERDGKVTLSRLPKATLADLQRELRRGEYHILHFIGHGGFVERAEDSALLLEDDQGRGRLVVGQDLGTILHGYRPLRLTVLNACEGARGSPTDPFSGVAQGLVQQGVPAVIAMQFEITDRAAITFAQEFYGALSDGYPVDTSLAEARRAIFASGNEIEWATPVLYMRSPNGRIFKIDRRPREAAPPPAEVPAVSIPEVASPAAEPPEVAVSAAEPSEVGVPAPEPLEAAVSAPEPERPTAAAPEPLETVAAAAPTAAAQTAPEEAIPPAVHEPTRPEAIEPPRPVSLPAAWWWIVVLGGAALVGAGIALPFASDSSGNGMTLPQLTAWTLLEPLAVVLAALAAVVAAANPTLHRVVKGPLIGFGVYGMLLFLRYILLGISGSDELGVYSSATPAIGAFVGLAGAVLLLWGGLSASPSAGPETPAKVGAERLFSAGMGLVLLGTAGIVLVTFAFPFIVTIRFPLAVAGTLPSLIPLAVMENAILIRVADSLALTPLGVAVAVGVCAWALLRWPERRVTAAGVILALAIGAFLFELTLIGVSLSLSNAGTGAYIGLLSGVAMVVGAVLVFRTTLRSSSEVSQA